VTLGLRVWAKSSSLGTRSERRGATAGTEKRFEVIADDAIREATWLERRRHVPQGWQLPVEVGMDSWYLRLPDDEDYPRRLSALTASAPKIPDEEVSLALWCGDSQAVPWPWPAAGTRSDIGIYTRRGPLGGRRAIRAG
jgi:hypothetical protein